MTTKQTITLQALDTLLYGLETLAASRNYDIDNDFIYQVISDRVTEMEFGERPINAAQINAIIRSVGVLSAELREITA